MSGNAQGKTSPPASLAESVRKQYLDAMGIQAWYDPMLQQVQSVQEATPPVCPAEETVPVEAPLSAEADMVEVDIDSAIRSCTACELHATRQRAVTGEGSLDARLMLIVDAPLEELSEDVLLTQASRNMLEAMLRAIGESLQTVYITSMVKCRPPESRAAFTSEVICCDDHLSAQIRQVQPQAIMALGERASQQLMVSQKPLGDLRLRHHQHMGVAAFASYHPTDLINAPENKRKAWQDLLQIKKQLVSAK